MSAKDDLQILLMQPKRSASIRSGRLSIGETLYLITGIVVIIGITILVIVQ